MSTQIELCNIYDSGNPPDLNGRGFISYKFQMAKYLITNEQYIEFLKSFTKIPKTVVPSYTFYDERFCINQKLDCEVGSLRRPVCFITPIAARAFCNFLYNKENNLPLDSESCYSIEKTKRLTDRGYFIPTKDEWYKAAYYNDGSYNLYPIKNNKEPTYVEVIGDRITNVSPTTCNFSNAYDFKNYNGFTSRVGECGSCSQYDVYDMAGNLYEYIEDGELLCLAGGSWHSFKDVMIKNVFIKYHEYTFNGSTIGLRVIKL